MTRSTNPRSPRAKSRGASATCLDFARHERKSGSLRLAGYAALFDVTDGAGDTIRRGAFARTLAGRRQQNLGPVPLLWQHNDAQRIGTVELAQEDTRGLRVIARIDNSESRAVTELVSRSTNGLSFGYRARGYRRVPGGRLLEDIELIEVSLVTHPLQPLARVHLVQ